MTCRLFRRRPAPVAGPPRPTDEALKEAAELRSLKPRVERIVRERDQLLGENNYAARIRALYLGGNHT
jgi:hypothetical protein